VGEALVRSDGHRREQHSPVGELAALDAAEVLDHVGDVAAGVDGVDEHERVEARVVEVVAWYVSAVSTLPGSGGKDGIRTHGRLATSTVFEVGDRCPASSTYVRPYTA
jgi:hypothetical protein